MRNAIPSGIEEPRHTAPVTNRPVERIDTASSTGTVRVVDRDHLAVEAPLELRQDGKPVVVIMRTPGHDAELVRGLLFAEGVIEQGTALAPQEPHDLEPMQRGNVLELGLASAKRLGRGNLLASSSCGACGKLSAADLAPGVTPVRSDLTIPAGIIAGMPEKLRAAQTVFDATGGLHAAAAFDPNGALLAVREDVGRHNAVDKLIGWAHAGRRLPLGEAVLCVSGRLSFEIVQKAVAAGVPVVVAVSAPSSLAVDLAERYRVTLCGFTRGSRFNVYSHARRVV